MAEHIVKKVIFEQQQPINTTMFLEQQQQFPLVTVRPLPHTLKHLIEKIKYERKYFQHEPVLTAMIEGGEFLQFLKTVVEEIQLVKLVEREEQSIFRRIKYLFGEKSMRFFKTLEKDVILSLVNVKPHFVQLFKTIIEQEVVFPRCERIEKPWNTIQTIIPTVFEQQQPRFVVPTTTVVPRIAELEQQRINKMFEVEPRLRLFRSPSEIVLPKYF